MNSEPVICFGQQPCGFFPKRFLFAKFQTARRLQSEIGGEIVFFLHDSDHDPRETKTVLRHRVSNEPFELNFTFANKVQRKYSPLYLKRVLPEWHEKTARRLPNLLDERGLEAFASTCSDNIADFCLEMYRQMGLLEGIRVLRSSDIEMWRAACEIDDFFVDISYQEETVRARYSENEFKLHAGGDTFLTIPLCEFDKSQISPTRDTRLKWMQSVVQCTHYVCGAGEQAYLCKEDAPEIRYVAREWIERSDEAYTEFPTKNAPLLAFGAHPDDIEFGVGGVIALETQRGCAAHLVVCSRGEAATHGTPQQRAIEAKNAAQLLGATLEWVDLDGDAHLQIATSHAVKLAAIIRRVRPGIVLAPSLVENQHPDHARLGRLARDAARLARYGGVDELRDLTPHAIGQLFFYAGSLETEPRDITPVLVDVSTPQVLGAWTNAMQAHATQTGARDYVELQLTRARLHGLACGVQYAIPLFPNDAIVVDSLSAIGRGARHF